MDGGSGERRRVGERRVEGVNGTVRWLVCEESEEGSDGGRIGRGGFESGGPQLG